MPKLKTATKTASKVKPLLKREDFFKMAAEYADLSAQIKVLEDRKKLLSGQIKDGCEKFGVADDRGSHFMENDTFVLGRVCKKSVTLDQDTAVQTLERMGLGECVDVVTVKTVNEGKLESAVSQGRISLNEVEEFSKVSMSFSVSVKKKEDAPEVEQTTLAAARTKK